LNYLAKETGSADIPTYLVYRCCAIRCRARAYHLPHASTPYRQLKFRTRHHYYHPISQSLWAGSYAVYCIATTWLSLPPLLSLPLLAATYSGRTRSTPAILAFSSTDTCIKPHQPLVPHSTSGTRSLIFFCSCLASWVLSNAFPTADSWRYQYIMRRRYHFRCGKRSILRWWRSTRRTLRGSVPDHAASGERSWGDRCGWLREHITLTPPHPATAYTRAHACHHPQHTTPPPHTLCHHYASIPFRRAHRLPTLAPPRLPHHTCLSLLHDFGLLCVYLGDMSDAGGGQEGPCCFAQVQQLWRVQHWRPLHTTFSTGHSATSYILRLSRPWFVYLPPALPVD